MLSARESIRPVLWLRARSRRGVVEEHLRHVAGSFRAAGWGVETDDHVNLPPGAALAVMEDPWVEPLPSLAQALTTASVGGPPAWRVPLVWGLSGKRGWRDKVPPATMLEYERKSVTRRRAVSLETDPWCGFAVAAPGQAEALLSAGWPPSEAALVSAACLFRYADPSAHERRELVRFVPDSARRVVDIGCGSGLFGALLRETGRTVIGIEPEWELAVLARKRLDLVLALPGEQGLEALRTPMDCVVLADVLEHSAPPQRLLRAAANALGQSGGGRLLVSFPNAAWAPIVRALAAGRWDTTLAGVQARDHLFYTTPKSFAAMAEECGLAVETLEPLGEFASFRERLWGRLAAFSAGGTFTGMTGPQWAAVLRPR